MAPPGRPNMTSVCSISRLLISAWAPVSCMVGASCCGDGSKESGQKKPPAWARGENARARQRRASGNYEKGGAVLHELIIMPEPATERKSLHLVERARVGGATSDCAAQERGTVLRAVETGSPGRREVAGVRTPPLPEDPQVVPDGPVQALHLVVGQFVGGPGRVDAGPPQRLVAQQVAEAGDAGLVHDHGLDRRPALGADGAELRQREVEGVWAEPVLIGVKLHRAESARVAQEHGAAVGEGDTEA